MMHFSIDSGYSRKISDTIGISTARVAVLLRKMESKDLIGKEKEHIVLQIINIIKLQRKNATILIRMLHFYLHFLYRMAFLELNPKIKNFKFLITDLFSNRQNPFHPAQFQDSVW